MNKTNSSSYLPLTVRSSIGGSIVLPASKSISIRALLLASLGEGEIKIDNFLVSEDTLVMVGLLERLGIVIDLNRRDFDYNRSKNVNSFCVTKGGKGFFKALNNEESIKLDVQNSGLSVRTILPVLALMMMMPSANCGFIEIDGVQRMRERPLSALFKVLTNIGADFDFLYDYGCLPCRLHRSKPIITDQIIVDTNHSSQSLTGLLQAFPLLNNLFEKKIVIKASNKIISRPYVDMTLKVLKEFGCKVTESELGSFSSESSRIIPPKRYFVEGDASSASYFLVAACLGNGSLKIYGLNRNSVQGDIQVVALLEKMGANVKWNDNFLEVSSSQPLVGRDIDCETIPDGAMALSALAIFCSSPIKLINIGSWKVKETDRISAIVEGLKSLGVKVEFGDDWLIIWPSSKLQAAKIKTFEDHRIAMTFSLASFQHQEEKGQIKRLVEIENPNCVRKTFPSFFDEFARVCSAGIPVITIDGPTASGKGTVARLVSERLGFNLLDSGMFYRVLALNILIKDINQEDVEAIVACAQTLNVRIWDNQVWLEKKNVSDEIRLESVGMLASVIAKIGQVRNTLMRHQRDFARYPGLVADGRDMGSIVFPEATVRVFLTAKLEIRAKRRFKQLIEKEIPCTLNDILQDISSRDTNDYERDVASLSLAKKNASFIIDSSEKSVIDVVDSIVSTFKNFLRKF